MTNTDTGHIARTIRSQFGPWALAAAGAADLAATRDGLYMSVRRHNGRRYNIVVTLTPADLYTVLIAARSPRSLESTRQIVGVYAEQLPALLDDIVTGADLSAWGAEVVAV